MSRSSQQSKGIYNVTKRQNHLDARILGHSGSTCNHNPFLPLHYSGIKLLLLHATEFELAQDLSGALLVAQTTEILLSGGYQCVPVPDCPRVG